MLPFAPVIVQCSTPLLELHALCCSAATNPTPIVQRAAASPLWMNCHAAMQNIVPSIGVLLFIAMAASPTRAVWRTRRRSDIGGAPVP